jgi:hypothetical protein
MNLAWTGHRMAMETMSLASQLARGPVPGVGGLTVTASDGSKRRSRFKKSLTGPTLLEMSCDSRLYR